jgi:small-conductance mechanosensitive channel
VRILHSLIRNPWMFTAVVAAVTVAGVILVFRWLGASPSTIVTAAVLASTLSSVISTTLSQVLSSLAMARLVLIEGNFADGDIVTFGAMTGEAEILHVRVVHLNHPDGTYDVVPLASLFSSGYTVRPKALGPPPPPIPPTPS